MGCQISKADIHSILSEPIVKGGDALTPKPLTPRLEPSKRFLTWDSNMSSSWDSMDGNN